MLRSVIFVLIEEEEEEEISSRINGGKYTLSGVSTLNRLHRSASSTFYEYSAHILGRDDETIFFTPASRATTRTCANAKGRGVPISNAYVYIYVCIYSPRQTPSRDKSLRGGNWLDSVAGDGAKSKESVRIYSRDF